MLAVFIEFNTDKDKANLFIRQIFRLTFTVGNRNNTSIILKVCFNVLM